MATYIAMVLIAAGLTTAGTGAQTGASVKVMTGTATIQSIDVTARTVTLRDDQGKAETYNSVGSGVTRLNEMKVGDTVRATYYESVVLQVRRPGDPAMSAAPEATVTRGQGALPSGAVDFRQNLTVTVKAIDLNAPSITVTGADGKDVTRKVEDKTRLSSVKVGDRIDITVRRAALVTIERATAATP